MKKTKKKTLKKPKPMKRDPIYDYFECRDYIQEKYFPGRDLDDFAGHFTKDGIDESKPYQNFWHHICDEVHNGSEMHMIEETEDWPEEEWVREIAKAFNKEFGYGTKYWVEW